MKTIHPIVRLAWASSLQPNHSAPSTCNTIHAADRVAKFRAHIDRIFQGFIHKDLAELRATHAENLFGCTRKGPPP